MRQDAETQNKLTLMRTVQETVDTKSFFFSHPSARRLSFKPGQFINIGVNIDGQNHYRAYSISSLPEDELIQLTIKRVNGGLVSNWMIDHLHLQDQISVHGIAGVFNIIDQPHKENVLFISAGCGITPVMAMSRYLLTHQKESIESIQFIHCARGAEHVIYDEEINSLSRTQQIFKPAIYLDSDEGMVNHSIYQKGPLNSARLTAHLKDKTERSSVYLCGPKGFMEAVAQQLGETGFNLEHFFQESFTPTQESPSKNADTQPLHTNETKPSEQFYRVTMPDFGFDDEAKAGETLLQVLQDGEVPIIAACRSGLCGSCKCKVNSGKIELTTDPVTNGLLTQEELDQGYTLACSSLIVDHVEVSLK